jgi:hypothetical protein
MSKAMQESLLKTIPLFNFGKAVTDPNMAKLFLFLFNDVAEQLHLEPWEINSLFFAKLDHDDMATQCWIQNLTTSNTRPTSFEDWKTLIWTQCNIPALERRYATKLKNFKQGSHMPYTTFHHHDAPSWCFR